jgi:hypothetical protein
MVIVFVTGSARAVGAIKTAAIPANRSLVMVFSLLKRERAAAPLDPL